MQTSENYAEGINLETKYGTIKGIPAQQLGWAGMALIAAFLVYQLSMNFNTKLDKMVESQNRTANSIERLIDLLGKTPPPQVPGRVAGQ